MSDDYKPENHKKDDPTGAETGSEKENREWRQERRREIAGDPHPSAGNPEGVEDAR